MSDIERRMIANHEAQFKAARADEKKSDFSWWKYDDAQTYFCVSTTQKYTFEPGQQIFTSYGRRSNKFLLTFYGFCIGNNCHDSVVMRIRRKVD